MTDNYAMLDAYVSNLVDIDDLKNEIEGLDPDEAQNYLDKALNQVYKDEWKRLRGNGQKGTIANVIASEGYLDHIKSSGFESGNQDVRTVFNKVRQNQILRNKRLDEWVTKSEFERGLKAAAEKKEELLAVEREKEDYKDVVRKIQESERAGDVKKLIKNEAYKYSAREELALRKIADEKERQLGARITSLGRDVQREIEDRIVVNKVSQDMGSRARTKLIDALSIYDDKTRLESLPTDDLIEQSVSYLDANKLKQAGLTPDEINRFGLTKRSLNIQRIKYY